jgi:hypothetical protein
VRFGRGACPKGHLPVFSVENEDEAQRLITLACPRDAEGYYYSRELAQGQTLETLQQFSDKLAKCYEIMKRPKS